MKAGEEINNSENETHKKLVIALAGNPNAGKTTLFNAITGLRQKVANYPGVTVERKEGVLNFSDYQARLIDLPGLYSLDASSLDEQIARDVLTGKVEDLPSPDLIISVIDATNLERNLYLFAQLLEYKIPIVIALTMYDVAEIKETNIDLEKLSKLLKTPVVAVTASTARGLDKLEEEIIKVLGTTPEIPVELKNFEDRSENSRIFARYGFISDVVQESVTHTEINGVTFSEKIDNFLTHKYFGYLFLIGILLLIFQVIFSWASLPMDLLEQGFGAIGEFAKTNLPEGLFSDLLVDGVIAGVGGVLVFLPQILLLFLFISVLEDTGYMARAAFLLDKPMSRVGLHGKAFLPLMSSFACAIPGIMATRTIENPKDRLATILIAPFMSCSARLPVYALMIATFFAGQTVFGFVSLGAVLMLGMYFLGIITALIVGWILKKTLLKSPPPPFVMELPPYRLPNFRNVFQNMFTRAWLFVKRAGTVILAISIILWGLMNFPKHDISNLASPKQEVSANDTEQKDAEESEKLKKSYAGKIGHIIEPVIKPLGFDWKIGVALIASFAAREVLVSTLGIIYNVEKDANEESESLQTAIRDAKNEDGTQTWSPLTALTLMVFFVLAMQCMSTIAVVRRETNSWAWTLFMVGYMTGLAYLVSFLTYQGGKLLGFA